MIANRFAVGLAIRPKLGLCLGLMLLAGPAFASRVVLRVLPGTTDAPVSVRDDRRDDGDHFTVLYKTNASTLDRLLQCRLDVPGKAAPPVEKQWTTNGVQYEFVIPPGQFQTPNFITYDDSKFTISEEAHVGDIPMPGVTLLWFHLRDFVPMPGIRVIATMATNGFYGHDFKVALRVENTSTTNQTVRMMSCSWEAEWESSNPGICFRGWSCTKNAEMPIVIPPGGAYTNEADLYVAALVPGSALTFRMGFTPIGGLGTSWSDELRVEELKAVTWQRGAGISSALAGGIETSPVFRIVVQPSTTNVFVNQAFKVDLCVENPTTTNETVRVMNCSWDDHWKCSNTNVTWNGWNCGKNFAANITIPPGGAYTNTLEMIVPRPIADKTLSFRMGFTPGSGPNVYWSEDVKINVLTAK